MVAVTGASRGLGSRIAVAAADAGAQVVLLARSVDAMAAVAGQIGPAARVIGVDVADPTSVGSAFEELADVHGRLDVLVNNAGAGAPQILEELSDEDLLGQMAVNFLGPLYCIRAALPLLRAAGGGDVINISSVAVLDPYPTMWLYSASKAALELASVGLVDELRPDGIRVSVLRSGSMDDTGFQAGWSEQSKQRAFDLAAAAGRERFAGGDPVAPELLAQWVVEIASLPPGVRAGLVELRPS